MKKIAPFAPAFSLIVLMGFLLNSCSYYEIKSFQSSDRQKMNSQLTTAQTAQRYFVVHEPDRIYALSQAAVDSTTGMLSGIMDSVTADHRLYIQRLVVDAKNTKYSAKKPEQARVIDEVHVFTNDTMNYRPGTSFSLPMDSVNEVRVIYKDKAATTLYTVLAVIVPVALISVFLIAPYVYGNK